MLSYEEAIEFFNNLEKEDKWLEWCIGNNVYHFYTTDYISKLASIINKLKTDIEKFDASSPIILEIAAGDGKLGIELNKNSIPLIITDSNSSNFYVEELSAKDALHKYNPQIVIAAWLPFDGGIEQEILQTPSVKYFFYICQSLNGSFGNESIWYNQNWDISWLQELDIYSLSRYDFTNSGAGIQRHSKTFLVKRK